MNVHPFSPKPLVGSLVCAALALVACGDNPQTPAGGDNNATTNNADNNGDNNAANNDAGNNANSVEPDADAGPDAPDNNANNNSDAPFVCPARVSLPLAADGNALEIVNNDGSDLEGLAWQIGPGVAPAGTEVEVVCEPDNLVPDGYIALSAPIRVGGPGGVRGELWRLKLPIREDRVPAGARESALKVFVRFPNGDVRAPSFVDLQEDLEGGFVSLKTRVFGVYQVGVAADAGTPQPREYVFRSITGVSMGAGGASLIGFKNPEKFDIVGALGGPTDWRYLAHYIREAGLGGFCPGANPDDPSTWSCDTFAPDEEFEHGMEFDDWYFSTGEGTGGTFDRAEYQSIFQDLSYAYGNMGSYNPGNPYLPAGMPFEEAQRPHDEVCPSGGYIIEEGYADDEDNPAGSLPVIAFCDGKINEDRTLEFDRYCDIDPEDGVPDQPNKGWYTGGEGQRDPMEIGFAVDYNRNGVRDRGEPVIRNFWEPFEDVGLDGVGSKDEPGYDPVTNPDPAGDDHDWAYNPTGTEGNWFWDDGEPWDDFGLDGVEGSAQIATGGYDWGEGNGTYDLNPNLVYLLQQNPQDALGVRQDRAEALRRLTFYGDGGIRDLFNFAVAGNHLAGAIQGWGGNVRVYDDFTGLAEQPTYDDIDVTQIDYASLGEHVHVRYGKPDADEVEVCEGDGKHVGEIFQTINRLLIMVGFILNRTPDGDKTVIAPPYPIASGTYWIDTDATGGRYKYSISLPPGYEYAQCSDGLDNDGDGRADGLDADCPGGDHTNEGGAAPVPRCADGIDNDLDGVVDTQDDGCDGNTDDSESEFFEGKRFPVIYLLHGYGQSPEDLRPSLLFLSGYMAGGFWPKAILVFPDGFCGETQVTQCSDGIDNDNDGTKDRQDEGCRAEGSNSEGGERLSICADGVDNDQDGATDLGEDHGCVDAQDDDEADCVQGTFYSNHTVWPDGTTPGPQYEDAILDLIDHVDANYRTKAPQTFDVVP
jgi:hypothetical protein